MCVCVCVCVCVHACTHNELLIHSTGCRELAGSDIALDSLKALPGHPTSFITCSESGELGFWDTRSAGSRPLQLSPIPPVGSDSGGTTTVEERERHAMDVCGTRCAVLSDTGEMRVYDRRGASLSMLVSCQLPLREPTILSTRFKTRRKKTVRPCVQVRVSSSLSISLSFSFSLSLSLSLYCCENSSLHLLMSSLCLALGGAWQCMTLFPGPMTSPVSL